MGEGERNIDFNLSTHHRRWVRIGLSFACVAYTALMLLHLYTGEGQSLSELAALAICATGLFLTKHSPRLGGGLGVFAIWLEVIFSLYAQPNGFDVVAVMVFPPLIVGASQLLGDKGGWGTALLTGIVAPIVVYQAQMEQYGQLSERYLHGVVVLELGLVATASLIGSFFRTIGSLLQRERENAAHARELAIQLERSQRMETVGKLAGGVAHDFNNLLTAITGSADVLRTKGDNESVELASELDAATERGSTLTRQLLTFARRDVVQEKLVDVGGTINALRRLISRLLGDSILFHVEADPDCTVRMDEGQLEQVVLNLATNAQEAIDGSGSFTLTVRRVGKEVILLAEDDGPGIDSQVATRVFEPFFSTKPRNKGSGLGLSTVHGVVSQWGGRIELRSAPNMGATFEIRFPYEEARNSAPPLQEDPTDLRDSRRTILFVEDDPIARRSVSRMLQRNNLDVVVASDGEEAWKLWEEGLRPALLVSDVIMPGITGAELAKRLRRENPNLPLLLISGYLDDVLEDSPFDTTTELLLKPFSTDELIRRISEKLGTAAVQPKSERRSLHIA